MSPGIWPEHPRVTRTAALAVLWFSVPFAVVQVLSYATFFDHAAATVVGGAAMAVGLPLHLQHLRYGLQGQRPPRGGLTLLVLAATQLVALLVIGPTWAFSLSLVATSALVVLRWPWAGVTLVCCLAAPFLVGQAFPTPSQTTWLNRAYLELLITMCQFTPLWLVAAAHQLQESRPVLAAGAETVERARLEEEVWDLLSYDAEALASHAHRVQDTLSTSKLEAASAGLERMLDRSRSLLATVRAIAAQDRATSKAGAAALLARAARDSPNPIGWGLVSRRATATCVLIHVIVLAFPLLLVTGAFGPAGNYPLTLVVSAWVLVVVLQTGLTLDTLRGRRPRAALARWFGLGLIAVATLSFAGSGWSATMWSVGAAGVMAFRHRPPAAAAVAALSVAAYAYAATWEGWGSSYRDGWSEGAVSVVTAVVVGAIVLIGLYASARMVAVIGALEGARDELVQDAAATVRQEIFRDLHDVLGQRLTAITLKTELARHFVLIDPARASAELTDVVEIACLLSHEVSQVNRGVRQATLSRELQDSIALLQVAGVTVRVRVATDGVDADSGALLAWAVREGATNIVRHTSAQRCDIAVRHEPNRLVFEMTNDGAAGSGLYGTGLAGLAARFSAAGGTVIAERGPRGKFRLEAALPTRLQPTGVTGDADGVESIAGA